MWDCVVSICVCVCACECESFKLEQVGVVMSIATPRDRIEYDLPHSSVDSSMQLVLYALAKGIFNMSSNMLLTARVVSN